MKPFVIFHFYMIFEEWCWIHRKKLCKCLKKWGRKGFFPKKDCTRGRGKMMQAVTLRKRSFASIVTRRDTFSHGLLEEKVMVQKDIQALSLAPTRRVV